MKIVAAFCLTILCLVKPAHANFIISSAIIEFTRDGPSQQDIEIISRTPDNDYITVDVSEIVNPGTAQENRQLIEDTAAGSLLVTPDKMVLDGNNRKILRFVLLNPPDDHEHIYRVAVKPTIKGVDNNSKVGLKILVGYEVLVIVRPAAMQPQFTAIRHGKMFKATNSGNTNIMFQTGQQCEAAQTNCKIPAGLRVYPGTSAEVELPYDTPVTYSVWDGTTTVEKTY